MEVAVLLQQSNSEFTALASEEIQLGIQWQKGHCKIQPLLLADVFEMGTKPCMSACVCALLLL